MIGEAIRTGLRRDGFAVDWVRDGDSADRVLRTEQFDLLLLDLGRSRKTAATSASHPRNSRSCSCCWSARATSCRVPRSRNGCTVGAKKSKATLWKCTSTD